MDVRHDVARPSWLCTACGQPWPCAAKREQMLQDFDTRRAELRGVLGALLLDAERDMPDMPQGDLYRRFVEWTYPQDERPSSRTSLRHPGFKS